MVGKTIRCPWHHACFNLETGRPDPPALDPVPRWRVERQGGQVVVKDRLPDAEPPDRADRDPGPMVIVGGGAAGMAAALTLRAEGYRGRVTMISADKDAPYDRPNLSKDYLAGSAPEDWMPLRDDQFFKDASIDLILEREGGADRHGAAPCRTCRRAIRAVRRAPPGDGRRHRFR